MTGLDTSVVMRLVLGEPAELAAAARAFFDEAIAPGGEPHLLADVVVAESYHSMRHHYDVPHDVAIAALTALVTDHARVRALGVAGEALSGATETTPGLIDRMLHAEYASAGAVTATFDKALARLPGTRLVG